MKYHHSSPSVSITLARVLLTTSDNDQQTIWESFISQYPYCMQYNCNNQYLGNNTICSQAIYNITWVDQHLVQLKYQPDRLITQSIYPIYCFHYIIYTPTYNLFESIVSTYAFFKENILRLWQKQFCEYKIAVTYIKSRYSFIMYSSYFFQTSTKNHVLVKIKLFSSIRVITIFF